MLSLSGEAAEDMPEDKAWMEKGRRLQQSLAHAATHGLALGGGESPPRGGGGSAAAASSSSSAVFVTPPRGMESDGVWYDDDGNPSPWVCKHCQFKSFSRAEVLGPFPGHVFTCERHGVVEVVVKSAAEGENSGGSSQAARRSSRKAAPRREWKGDDEDGDGRSGGSMGLASSPPKAATMVLGFNGGRCVASTTPPSLPPSMFPRTGRRSCAHPLDLLFHASMPLPAAKSKPKNNTLSRLLSLEDALTIAAALHSTARPSSCTLRETNEGAIVVDLVTVSAGKGRFHRSADILVLHPFGGAGGAGGARGAGGGGVVAAAEDLHMPSSPVLLRFEAEMNTTSSRCDQTTHMFPQVCQDGVVTHGVNGCIENGALLQNSPHCFDQTSVAAFRRTGLAGAGKNKRTHRSSSSSSTSSSNKSRSQVNSGPSSSTRRAKRSTTSAFVVFVQDTRPSLAHVRPDLSFDEIGRTIGRMWGALSPEEKQPYEARAALDTARKERRLQERLSRDSRHSSAGRRGARRGARGARADAVARRRKRGGGGARGSSSDDDDDDGEDDASSRSNDGNASPSTEDALSLDDLLRQELSCVTSIPSTASTTNARPPLAMATTPPSTTPATTPPSNS